MWGHPMLVLGALCSLLEPFCGHLSPKIDKVSEELTLRYPHEGPWVGPEPQTFFSPSYLLLRARLELNDTTVQSLECELALEPLHSSVK